MFFDIIFNTSIKQFFILGVYTSQRTPSNVRHRNPQRWRCILSEGYTVNDDVDDPVVVAGIFLSLRSVLLISVGHDASTYTTAAPFSAS